LLLPQSFVLICSKWWMWLFRLWKIAKIIFRPCLALPYLWKPKLGNDSNIYIKHTWGGMKQAYTSMTCPKCIGHIYTIWNLKVFSPLILVVEAWKASYIYIYIYIFSISQISRLLEIYMVINFRICGINWDIYKLIRTLTLIIK